MIGLIVSVAGLIGIAILILAFVMAARSYKKDHKGGAPPHHVFVPGENGMVPAHLDEQTGEHYVLQGSRKLVIPIPK